MKRIEDIDKTTPDLPLHRAQLRRALLAAPQFEGATYSFMKKLLPVGLVLMFLLAFNVLQNSDSSIELTPQASAAELVSEVLERVQALNTADLAVIQEQLHLSSQDEIDQLLLDAAAAPDLAYMDSRLISCEEAAQLQEGGQQTVTSFIVSADSSVAEMENPGCTSAYVVQARPDDTFPEGYFEIHILGDEGVEPELTYLEYTNDEGMHVVLGLSDDLLPVYTIQIGDAMIVTGVHSEGSDYEGALPQDGTECNTWQSEDGLMGGGGC